MIAVLPEFQSHSIRPPGASSVPRLTTLWAVPKSLQEQYQLPSNPGPPDYNFDDINNMPFTTLLTVKIAEWSCKRHIIYVIQQQI